MNLLALLGQHGSKRLTARSKFLLGASLLIAVGWGALQLGVLRGWLDGALAGGLFELIALAVVVCVVCGIAVFRQHRRPRARTWKDVR